jgi:hypothetical protein
MARPSDRYLTLAAFTPPGRRLDPPADLRPEAVTAFRETVAAVPVTHFQAEDRPLLAQYAQATVLLQRASGHLAADPIVDGRSSPWLEIYRTALKATLSLAVRLRLGARSRSTHQRTGKPEPPLSYYERMRLEEAGDQD